MVRRKLLVPLVWGWMPFLSLALVVSLTGCQGQLTLEEVPVKALAGQATAESRSVQVGEVFPNIELKDQDGKPFGMKKTLADGPVVLVVYRSADW